jgi:hypothetical protein
MSQAGESPRKPRQLKELRDVYDFLDKVRSRPGAWVDRSSLQHLNSMLIGYRVALAVHGVEEEFDFWHDGPFSKWLWRRLGRSSALGWAREIEHEAAAAGRSSIEAFFDFLDGYKAEQHGPRD